MKRTALIFLTAIYLISFLGIGVNRFYCCGKLASVTLIYGAADNAGKETGKKKNCCRNEKQSFKIKDSHYSIASFSLNHPAPLLISSFANQEKKSIINLLHTKIVFNGNAPPGHSDIPVYTFNCTYRI